MIEQAAGLGFQPYSWTIMPFDFDAPVSDMGTVSIQAGRGPRGRRRLGLR